MVEPRTKVLSPHVPCGGWKQVTPPHPHAWGHTGPPLVGTHPRPLHELWNRVSVCSVPSTTGSPLAPASSKPCLEQAHTRRGRSGVLTLSSLETICSVSSDFCIRPGDHHLWVQRPTQILGSRSQQGCRQRRKEKLSRIFLFSPKKLFLKPHKCHRGCLGRTPTVELTTWGLLWPHRGQVQKEKK